LKPEEHPDFILSFGAVKNILVRWESNPSIAFTTPHGLELHPLTTIRRALEQCPDEPLAVGAGRLMFVTDADLRDVLARDIGAVDRALANGEWKAATVLAGSLVEALLLWKVGQPEYAEKVGATLVASKLRELAEKRGGSALEHGGLGDYLVLVKEGTIALRAQS